MSQSPPAAAKPSTRFAALTSQPYLLLVLAPLLWGGNVVAGKLAVGHIDPYLLVTGRWIGATLFALVLSRPYLRHDWPLIRAAWPILAFYGVVGFTCFNLLMYGAAHFTSATNASIEQAAIPVLVLIGNFIVFKVRARPLQIGGLILTIFGVVWVATHGEPARILNLSVNLGDGMVLLATLAYAVYSLLLRYKPDIHWLSFIFAASFFAMLTALAFQMTMGGGITELVRHLPEVTPRGWLCVLYTTIFPSIVAQLCYARGVEIAGPNRASIFINLLPIFGTVLSVLIVGEYLQPYHFISAGLVLTGIILSEVATRRLP